MATSGPRVAAIFTCMALITLSTIAPMTVVATSADAPESSLIVEVDADGNAEILLNLVFELETADEQDAFETLRTDADAREDMLYRFESRMDQIANEASANTGRSMTVDSPEVEIRTTGDGRFGIVTLGVTWQGLAALEDDRLVISEPFASGYEPDVPLTITVPSTYEIDSATPEPSAVSDTEVAWEAGSDLDGFELTATSETGTQADESDSRTDAVPGFGIGLTVLSVGVLSFLFRFLHAQG